MRFAERCSAYGRLMRLDRPIGTWLLVWPMLWALWIAGEGHPDGFLVVLFLLGALIMRSAGCVINDFADRELDPLVRRTRGRPLASGEIQPFEALALFLGLLSLAGFLVWQLNRLTIALAVVAVLLASLYPFVKRWSHLPQLVLGIAFAWSIPMAFAAVRDSLPLDAWMIFLASVAWTVAYDTMYAMVDREDDIVAGIKSTAILFGKCDTTIILALQLLMFGLLCLLGQRHGWGGFYYLGLACALGFATWQQYLIRERDRDACFRAFLNNHYLGAAIFLGLFFEYA